MEEMVIIMTFIVLDKNHASKVEIQEEYRSNIINTRSAILDNENAFRYFNSKKCVSIHSYLLKLHQILNFSVSTTKKFIKTDELICIAEVATKSENNKFRIHQTFWHPGTLLLA